MEHWKDIEGFPGYRVSDHGQVTGKRGQIMKGGTTPSGYRMVLLSRDGRKTGRTIHRLVAAAFVANPENKPTVNHKDGDRRHNSASNLEWMTQKENNRHSITVLGKHHIGEKNGKSKLTKEQIVEILRLFRDGLSGPKIARIFGIHHNNVYSVIARKTWKHVA